MILELCYIQCKFIFTFAWILKVKPHYVHAHLSDSCTGYNYVPVYFYSCKFYDQGINISWVFDKSPPSVRQNLYGVIMIILSFLMLVFDRIQDILRNKSYI